MAISPRDFKGIYCAKHGTDPDSDYWLLKPGGYEKSLEVLLLHRVVEDLVEYVDKKYDQLYSPPPDLR